MDQVALATACYIDKYVLVEPVTTLKELECLHFSKMLMSAFLCEGNTAGQAQNSIF